MSDERPLHVRVAEALGWTELRKIGGILIADNWAGWPPGQLPIVGKPRPEDIAPRYDTDWSATGPLIEKYRLEINFSDPFKPETAKAEKWHVGWHLAVIYAVDENLLVALCKLILALKEAGKLK